MKIAMTGFTGESRAVHPLALPGDTGILSTNQNPARGDLRPWKAPLTVASVPAGRNTIYRMGRDTPSDALYWLSWTGIVHAVRAPNAEDTTERTYYTGDGVPKWTDNTLALATAPYPTAFRLLGVPAPVTAPTLVASAAAPVTAGAFVVGSVYVIATVGTTDFTLVGSANNTIGTNFTATGVGSGTGTVTSANSLAESRYYVYTYVTDKGEESASSPPSLELVCKTDSSVAISAIANPPSGAYGINRVRIYRTQSGTSGSAEFFFLREIASSVPTSTDDGRTLGEVLPSTTWLTPPADLTNLTAMWNGMIAGITGQAVRVCEPFKPYAWPLAYEVLPPDSKPVALKTFGQSMLVLTTGRPRLVTGGSPEALDDQPVEWNEACVSARSAVSFGHGVVWACPDGLAYLGSGGPKMITAGLMTRDDWRAIKPETIVGSMYEGAYLGMYTVSGVTKGFLIDPLNPAGLYFTDIPATAFFFDELQDQLYLLEGVNIKKWDAGTALTATFRSKRYRAPRPISMAGAAVKADNYPVTLKIDMVNLPATMATKLIAVNPSLTSPNATSVRFTKTVSDSDPFRLPSGFTYEEIELEVSTTGAVQIVELATSIAELSK